MPLPQFQPIPLTRIREPFSHPEWICEVKWDGFRSLAYVSKGDCHLISRNGNQFQSFPALAEAFPAELCARSAVLDGEIVCLDRHGKTQFKDLLFRRGEPRFYAFDLLWPDGEDLRYLLLIDRKLRLRSVVPKRGDRLLYCDHIEEEAKGCSALYASMISKALSPNGNPACTCRERRRAGSKSGTAVTASGSGGRNYSKGSGEATRIFVVGISAQGRVRRRGRELGLIAGLRCQL
jgi:hypothetical protein